MTEEEVTEYLLAVEAAVEEFLLARGYDVDLSMMSWQEREQFFFRLDPADSTALRDYVSFRTSGSLPTDDPLDLAMDLATPIFIGNVPIPIPSIIKSPAKIAGKILSKIPGVKWIAKHIDESIDLGRAAEEAGPVLKGGPKGAGWVSGAPPITQVGTAGMVGAAGVAAGAAAANIAVGGIDPHEAYKSLQGEVDIFGLKIPSPFGGGPNVVTREELALEGEPGFEEYLPETEEEKKAREEQEEAMAPATVESIVEKGKGIMKQLYFDGLSEEAVFDKMTNYIQQSPVHVLEGTGLSVAEAIEAQEGLIGQVEIYPLEGDINSMGAQKVGQYLKANWQNIPAIAEHPLVTAVTRDYPEGNIIGPMAFDESSSVDAAIEDMLSEMVRVGDTLLMAPEDPGNKLSHAIGFITSYDGTQYGDIHSLNDFFSGGKIGPLNFLPKLERARPEQIAFWQQQLFAWGFLEEPPEVWGQITETADGSRPTLEAAHRWQISIFNEGVDMVRQAKRGMPTQRGQEVSLSDLIAPDGSPRIDRVMDRAIASQMAGTATAATRDNLLRDRVIGAAQTRIGEYLESTGRMLPEGSKFKIQSGLRETLSGLSEGQQERAFGQGGSQYERNLAENLLSEFYGTDDWGSMLSFGKGNRDSNFFNYAARVGAVSERERELLKGGGIFRDRYREHWTGREEQLTEAEKDVAVASLLKFIGQSALDLPQATASQIAQGLSTYMHTIGVSRGLDNPQRMEDLEVMANRAMNKARTIDPYAPDQEATAATAMQGVDDLGLRGGVAGAQYTNLVNALNSIGRSTGNLGTRNV